MARERNKLRVASLNVHFLVNKLNDVSAYVNQPEPFHLFGLSETRLNPNISDEAINIPNFSVVRRDPCTPGQTGLAVYIHDSIRQYIRRRSDLENQHIEGLWLEFKHNKSRPLIIGFVYRNPAAKFEWYDDFLQNFDSVDVHKSDILLLGDFNINMLKSHAAWDCTTTLVGLKQLVTSPTRVTSTSATLIDHIYSNNPESVSDVCVGRLSVSDHFPVSCSWSTKLPVNKKHCHTTVTYRCFKHFHEAEFLADLHCTPFHLVYSETDPDRATELWYSLFNQVLDKHAPLRQKRVKNRTPPPWLTSDIIEAMEVRDRLKEEKLFLQYKKQRNRVKKLVLSAKKSLCEKLIKDGKNTALLWQAVNLVTRGGSKRSSTIPSDLSPNSFNDHFLSVAESLVPSSHDSHPYTCPDILLDFCQQRTAGTPSFTIPPLAVHEVGKLITTMANKKSCGSDQISAKLLKISLPYIVEPLTYVYNLCIQRNTFPAHFKDAKVVPLPKSNDLTSANNFRPISLLSILSKPLERHIQKHLQRYLDNRNLLYSFQSGFRSKHSCHTALTRLIDNWLLSMNQSQLTGTLFLDLSKAFDLVNHNILLSKLGLYLCNTAAVSFFRSYLSNRTQRVFHNGLYSSSGIVRHGVPQGFVLGPLLFCLFINDLPLHLRNKDVICDLFADDATLHTPDKSVTVVSMRLQQSLQEVSDWCNTNRMVLNPSKTECMIITTRQKHQLEPLSLSLSLNGTAIKQVAKHRLLGVTVDNQLQWKFHIEHICKIISKNLFMLSKLRYITDTETRKVFFNAHVRSHIDYASTVWDGSSESNLKRLNSLHRRAAKLILPESQLSTDQKLKKLEILPLSRHFQFNKGVFMFKMCRQSSPSYISNMFTEKTSERSRAGTLLKVPYPRIDIYKTSLAFSGSSLWNSLPIKIKSAVGLPSFKNSLFSYLF